MKKSYILTAIVLFAIAITEGFCSPVLISVELPTMESKKAWQKLGIPTYELIGNTAIAEVDESMVSSLNRQGYRTNIIDLQPDVSKYMIISDPGKNMVFADKPVWNGDRISIISPASKAVYTNREFANRIRPMNAKPLGERFWKSVTTRSVSLKNISYDPQIKSLVDQVNSDSIASYIQRLQDFRTRFTLTDSSIAATEWMANKLSDWGYTSEYDSFYIVLSDIFPDDSLILDSGYARNVVASKDGKVFPECINIISGHYDTPPCVDDTSTIIGLLGPGADDNASGTAGSMEVSRVLATQQWNNTIRFCAWAAEEDGLVGSYHYANYADSIGMDIVSMFNMDMIGYGIDSIDCGRLTFGTGWLLDLAAQIIPLYIENYQYDTLGGDHCDDQQFHFLGYSTMSYEEQLPMSPERHLLTDSLKTLNTSVFTKNTKAAVAMMAVILHSPKSVEFIKYYNIGDGNSLVIEWLPIQAPDVVGYRLYYGMMSETYSDTLYIPGGIVNQDTINGLWTDSTYYFTVNAIDSGGHESIIAYEIAGIPRIIPLAPTGLTAVPVDSGIVLKWKQNMELDLTGYDVCRSVNGGAFDSLATALDSFYLDGPLSGSNRYYYKVRARDNDGNNSPLSDSVYSRPITLDQGVLVVDETNNWTTGSFPRDAQQDSFYDYIMAGYKYEQYEYGSSVQKPILADFGPYSTVAWFADDYTTILASGAVNDLKDYLGAGGKLWYAGWKPSGNIHNTTSYPADYTSEDVSYDQFKITHAELSGAADSFQAAIGFRGYPDIAVDTLKYPASTLWGKTMRYIETLTPMAGADTIYVMGLKNEGSSFEGRACAVRDSGKTVFFGFPMYFMDKEQAKLAAEKVMAEFGEEPLGITGKPETKNRTKEFRLDQNAPNPFDKQTTIRYQLPKAGVVQLNIYNIAGQLVKTFNEGYKPAGDHQINWDDNLLPNGIYFYRLQAGDLVSTKRLLIVR